MLRIVHERGGHEEVGSEQQVGLDELCRLAAQEMLALALEAERQGYLERHAVAVDASGQHPGTIRSQQIAALLSINLGVLNLLPLPMLDGGRVLFLLIEVVRRGRRIAPEKEAFVHMIGFVVFLSLALVITFFDISRIASGESLFR